MIEIDKITLFIKHNLIKSCDFQEITKLFTKKTIENLDKKTAQIEKNILYFINNCLFQIEYNKFGLFINFNPNLFYINIDKIFDIIKKKYLINFEFAEIENKQIDLSRLDFCIDNNFYNFYIIEKILKNLKLKRLKTNYYPSSLLFRNKSLEIIFYDKKEELKYKIEKFKKQLKKGYEKYFQDLIKDTIEILKKDYDNNDNLLRCEIRLKTKQKIFYFKIKNYFDLLNIETDEIYKKKLFKQIFDKYININKIEKINSVSSDDNKFFKEIKRNEKYNTFLFYLATQSQILNNRENIEKILTSNYSDRQKKRNLELFEKIKMYELIIKRESDFLHTKNYLNEILKLEGV